MDRARDAESASASSSARASSSGAFRRGLLLAQACALVNATSAAASAALERRGVALPSWQTFYAYALMACAFAPGYVARKRRRGERWDAERLGRYAALALADAEANYFVTRAFKYTSLTSVSLLDSATIPFAMVLSMRALGARYGAGHCAGGALAFVGLTVLVLGDASKGAHGGTSAGSNVPLGDFLAVVAAALYATSNVLNEGFLRDADKVEILAHLGVFGTAISGVQSAVLEGMRASQLKVLGATGAAFFALYAVSLLSLYTFAMDVLELCGASAFNVSMLSSDVWSFVIRLMFFGGFASSNSFIAFVAAFLLVAAGICIFALAGDPTGAHELAATSAPTRDESFVEHVKHLFFPDHRRPAMTYVRMSAQDDDMHEIELTPMQD